MKRIWIIKEITGEASEGWKAEDLEYEFISREEAESFLKVFILDNTLRSKDDYIILKKE